MAAQSYRPLEWVVVDVEAEVRKRFLPDIDYQRATAVDVIKLATVARTIGGVAKRPVASRADTGLDPKSSSIGIR